MDASKDDGKNINAKEVELMSLGAEGRSSNRTLRLTVNSGAGGSVCGPKDAPDFRIRPSAEQEKRTPSSRSVVGVCGPGASVGGFGG